MGTTSEKSPIIGIDLGTSNSLVALLLDGVPTILKNEVDEPLTPSAVSIEDDGTVLVGAAAKARAVTSSLSTALAFKRDMGTDKSHEKGPVRLGLMFASRTT